MFAKRLLIFLFVFLTAVSPCLAQGRGSVILVPESEELDGGALPLSGFKIGIDPGHQLHADTDREPIAPDSDTYKAKVATGTRGVFTGKPEHATNLEIALLLEELLKELGAEVLMTRETADVNVSNIERASMMNDWGADAVVRLHCNGSTNHAVHGMGMYIRKTGACAEESEALARCLLASMSARTGAKAQGVYKRDTYTGLNWSTVPSVLVEMGYMTNAEEDKKLNDPAYQELLALGIADGLMDYLLGK